MENKTIVFITDFDPRGSGYRNLSLPFLTRMIEDGHEVIVLGTHYSLTSDNSYPFHLIPCMSMKETSHILKRLSRDVEIDALIVAADLMWHKKYLEYFEQMQIDLPYYAMFPVESPPMAFSWLLPVSQARKLFCFTEFGTEACEEVGFDATFLPIGLDTSFWHLPTEDKYKEMYRLDEDEFVILTIADNQERKNLIAAMDIVNHIQDNFWQKTRYILVTRENMDVGYALRDYAMEIGLDNFEIVERGISQEVLREMYWGADLFLLTSKAEGLGMPVLEAMACGLPVAGTDACAIAEHLQGGKNGIPLPVAYQFRDSYNNGFRYLVDPEKSAERIMQNFYGEWQEEFDTSEYLESRNFDLSYKVLMEGIFGNE